MSKRLIHLQTVVVSLFGVVDEDDNLREQFRVTNERTPESEFSAPALMRAYEELAKGREKLIEQHCTGGGVFGSGRNGVPDGQLVPTEQT